jgi:hypothetical protein
LKKMVKHEPSSNLENSQTSSIIEKPSTKIACPFSPLHLFKDEKSLKTHIGKYHCDKQVDISNTNVSRRSIQDKLINLRSNIHTLRRIPKGARNQSADKLSSVIHECINSNSILAWENLFVFAYISFNLNGSKIKNLTSKIKDNIAKFNLPSSIPKINGSSTFQKRIEAKVNDFDIRGAVKILSSDDKLAPFDEVTFNVLKTKHPTPSRPLSFPEPPLNNIPVFCVNESDVLRGINSFYCGSGPGIDGMRPQFLKDMVSFSAGEAGKRALTAITKLCNFILDGKINEEVLPIFFGASLCALSKKDGGLRPIAIGCSFRRLAARVACFKNNCEIHSYLAPHQLGVATKKGSEMAIHTVRTYLNLPENNDKIMLKIDFANAFNSVERDKMLLQIKENFPILYPFMNQSYRLPSSLFFGDKIISSEVGVQQGDPCGPMAFSVSIQPLVMIMTSELNIWYLDDATLADTPDIVLNDLRNLIELAAEIGLKVNTDKCEIFFNSKNEDMSIIQQFEKICPGIRIVSSNDLQLLGAPIFEEAYVQQFRIKEQKIKLLISRLDHLNSHVAYFLLKNCLFIPRLTYFIRTCALWKFPSLISEIDSCLRKSLTCILNININDIQWLQATLPVSKGGLGIRRISDVCLIAFLSSAYGVQNGMSSLLPTKDIPIQVHLLDTALEEWSSINSVFPSTRHIQKCWDNINITRIITSELQFNTVTDIARFKALQCNESGSWLDAIPSKNIGTFLDLQDFQVCVGLRLGCELFENHLCNCRTFVNAQGIHGLSCTKSKGRLPRHSELNSIIQRVFSSIHIPATLEPTNLSRDDGKRPDGATLTPWSKGQRLIWDVTCVDTLANSYLSQTSVEAGAAAEIACRKKHEKYKILKSANFIFKALAFETLGPWCEETRTFINTIGSKLVKETGNVRAKQFLRQRLSLAIQRGNATSIRGTLPHSPSLDEIFLI